MPVRDRPQNNAGRDRGRCGQELATAEAGVEGDSSYSILYFWMFDIFHNKVGLFLNTPHQHTAFSNLGNKNHIHDVKTSALWWEHAAAQNTNL